MPLWGDSDHISLVRSLLPRSYLKRTPAGAGSVCLASCVQPQIGRSPTGLRKGPIKIMGRTLAAMNDTKGRERLERSSRACSGEVLGAGNRPSRSFTQVNVRYLESKVEPVIQSHKLLTLYMNKSAPHFWRAEVITFILSSSPSPR